MAVPSVPALQVTFVTLVVMAGAPGLVTDAVDLEVHPFASVTVTEYVPTGRAVAVEVVCEGVVAQE